MSNFSSCNCVIQNSDGDYDDYNDNDDDDDDYDIDYCDDENEFALQTESFCLK